MAEVIQMADAHAVTERFTRTSTVCSTGSRPTSLPGKARPRSSSAWRTSDELDQRADAEAGAALDDLAVDLAGVGRAGDVEVRPRDALAHELLQEQPGGERAAVAAGPMFLMSATSLSSCLR